eukprot:4004893-Amphidinium_carterae.1
MTPGGMEIFPQNYVERIFNMCCLVFGLLFGTSLVGHAAALMLVWKTANDTSLDVELRRMEELRRFLRENKQAFKALLRLACTGTHSCTGNPDPQQQALTIPQGCGMHIRAEMAHSTDVQLSGS